MKTEEKRNPAQALLTEAIDCAVRATLVKGEDPAGLVKIEHLTRAASAYALVSIAESLHTIASNLDDGSLQNIDESLEKLTGRGEWQE